MSEWISVEERLPPNEEEVLAFCDGAAGSFLIIGMYDEIMDAWTETWSHDYLYSVTHWMPLPEPPRE